MRARSSRVCRAIRLGGPERRHARVPREATAVVQGPLTPRRDFLGGALSALVLSGCRCSEDRPYTPFHIEPRASASASASAPIPSPSASASGPSTAREAALAPKDVSSWTIDGLALTVASERVIERALTAD